LEAGIAEVWRAVTSLLCSKEVLELERIVALLTALVALLGRIRPGLTLLKVLGDALSF
jgi:hypothetical protein